MGDDEDGRMTRAQDAMRSPFVMVANMAGLAQTRPLAKVGKREHPLLHIGSIGRTGRGVAGKPALRTTVAGFAADPIGQREPGTPLCRRHIVRVARKA